MKIKKYMLLVLFILIVFIPKEQTYAHWNEYSASISNQNSIMIGNWIFGGIPEWTPDPVEPYQAGDIVLYNGAYYIRTSRGGGPVGSMFAPDSSQGWLFWDDVE